MYNIINIFESKKKRGRASERVSGKDKSPRVEDSFPLISAKENEPSIQRTCPALPPLKFKLPPLPIPPNIPPFMGGGQGPSLLFTFFLNISVSFRYNLY